ncbi:type II toxin-antitoxin system CcdA family antitoxin [Marinobacter litoralis]|nr:type II toxin-antitoxin system CcdA family antitoxin [Marinobacter litoralis]
MYIPCLFRLRFSAITTYNDFIEQHGCFGDEFREF